MSVALVTGAGGFVGSHLAVALSDGGRAVRALEHRAPAPIGERIRGSLCDPGTRRAAVRGVETIFHCAAVIDSEGADAAEVNHRATLALARDAAEAGARRFVFLSSQAVLGSMGPSGPLREDAPCAPETRYGQSKLAAERALIALAPMRVTIVRPPLIYGPRERRSFLALTRAIARGVFPIVGDGRNRTSFCHVENLIAALLFLERRDVDGVIHVADARPIAQRDAVRTIARALERRPLLVPLPHAIASTIARVAELAFASSGRRAPLDRARVASLSADRPLDTGRIAALGFTPPVAFEEGVRETIDSYRADRVLS